MKKIESSAGRVLVRTTCFLLAGIMTSMVFIGVDTHSWFTSNARAVMEVRAVTTDSILTIVGLRDSKREMATRNPSFIEIKGANSLNGKSLIYFSVEGKIAEYILHINPVWLESSNTYLIPIDLDLNIKQFTNLARMKKTDLIEGIIKVKYLNEFINEEIPVSFTVDYLRSIHHASIVRSEVEIIENDDARTEITNTITYLASHLEWVNSGDMEMLLGSPITMSRSSSENLMSVNLEMEILEEVALEVVPVDKFLLNTEQSSIISIIAPPLQGYIDRLYSIVVELVAKLNDKIIMITNLEKQIEGLYNDRTQLSKLLEEYKQRSESLEAENSALAAQNKALLDEIATLQEALQQSQIVNDVVVVTPSINPEDYIVRKELEGEGLKEDTNEGIIPDDSTEAINETYGGANEEEGTKTDDANSEAATDNFEAVNHESVEILTD